MLPPSGPARLASHWAPAPRVSASPRRSARELYAGPPAEAAWTPARLIVVVPPTLPNSMHGHDPAVGSPNPSKGVLKGGSPLRYIPTGAVIHGRCDLWSSTAAAGVAIRRAQACGVCGSGGGRGAGVDWKRHLGSPLAILIETGQSTAISIGTPRETRTKTKKWWLRMYVYTYVLPLSLTKGRLVLYIQTARPQDNQLNRTRGYATRSALAASQQERISWGGTSYGSSGRSTL